MDQASQKNKRVAFIAVTVFAGMICMSYAAVPLYKAFCQTTGFGGTTQRAQKAPDKATDQFITVRFDANTSSALPWEFHPRQTTMKVKIGEQNIAYYDARNMGSDINTGTAVFNVSPASAGAYFDKIQCFCFTKQTLKAGQAEELPVSFFVDPALLDDADAKNIKEITLSYTFYPAADPAVQSKSAANTN
jgi:cytochrome c oxidase assembly protein subunit 11